MSDAENVQNLVKSLTIVSNNILVKMVPIMQNLVDPDNDIVEEIVYSTKIEDKAKVNTWLQNQTVFLIENSEKVKREADKFLKSYKEDSADHDLLYKNVKQYPFLAEVWFGDNYDGKEGVEALQTLLAELKSELDNSNEDDLIETGIRHFSKLAE